MPNIYHKFFNGLYCIEKKFAHWLLQVHIQGLLIAYNL